MELLPLVTFLITSFTFAVLVRWRKSFPSRSLPLPPGPKGWPFVGNLLQAPINLPWKIFYEWSKVYGLCFLLHYEISLTAPRWYNVSLDPEPTSSHFEHS